jgi:transcription elongation factor GreA
MSNYTLSKKAYEELKSKLDDLKNVKRKAIVKAIQEAREHGDLKENSAYHEAKKEQSLNESKIAQLEEKLSMAEVVDDRKTAYSEAVAGATVKIKDLKTKETLTFTLVSDLEANILENKISTSVPLGKALLYHKVNETVEFEAPLGTIKYKILKIS